MKNLLILLVILFVIGVNILIYKLIVRRAIKKFIIPYIEKNGYKLQKVESVGLFSTGDFKQEFFNIRPIFKMGSPYQNIYVNIHACKIDSNNSIRFTAKIGSLFLIIKKVEYSHELKG